MGMPKNTERVSVYLTEGERLALRLAARQLGLSENAVIKLLIRDTMNLDIPVTFELQLAALRESNVTFSQK